jgi:hypothetical protein
MLSPAAERNTYSHPRKNTYSGMGGGCCRKNGMLPEMKG